jgi:predicted nucleic acid-binding protein
LKLVLDTNIYCDYAEGVPNVVDFLATYSDDIFFPSVVIGELTYGFMKGSRQKLNESKLREIIKKLRIEVIDVNQNVARKYAFICLSLVKKGTKIPINDVWIAACCMEVGGTLVTRDRHFRHVEQIETMVLDN